LGIAFDGSLHTFVVAGLEDLPVVREVVLLSDQDVLTVLLGLVGLDNVDLVGAIGDQE
jgi:hypothetical protein